MAEPLLDMSRVQVIVAEDYAPMRKLIGTMLFELNVENFELVASGKEALEKFEEFTADLLIVDNKMSPVNGIDLTRMVRTGQTPLPPETPIIMVSGELERGLIVGARDAGINEFLAKPLSTQMLLQRYRGIVENPKPFVRTEDFYGPDRRRRQMRFPGLEQRKKAYDYSIEAPAVASAQS